MIVYWLQNGCRKDTSGLYLALVHCTSEDIIIQFRVEQIHEKQLALLGFRSEYYQQ